jgi:hypothetical protein
MRFNNNPAYDHKEIPVLMLRLLSWLNQFSFWWSYGNSAKWLLPSWPGCSKIPAPEFMAIVSITRLRVRSWRYLVPFLFYALRSFRQARHSQGKVAASLLRDRDRTFWTCTVWTTESAMKEFMVSGAHRQSMRKLLAWCDEAALVRWEQENHREPNWAEAHLKL